jgi:O-antigen ligase
MQFLILFLVAAAFVILQVLIGGTRMVFALPGLELVALAGVLAAWPKLKTARGAGLIAISSAVLFIAYIIVRNRVSLNQLPFIESIGRTQLVIAAGSLIVYGIVALVLYKPSHRQVLVWVWLFMAVVQVVVGAIQFKEGNQWMPISWLQRADDWWRASGLYISPNHFAGYLEITGLMAGSFVLWGRTGWISKVLAGYVALCCVAGVAISGSRGGYLSLSAGALALFILSVLVFGRLRPERLVPVGIAAALVMVAVFFGVTALMTKSDFVRNRMENVADKENMRFLLWNSALKQHEISPVVGTGGFTFIYFGRKFRDPSVQNDPVHVHNDYLQLFADYGNVGAGLFLLFYFAHLTTGSLGLIRIVGRAHRDGVMQSNGLALNVGALSGLAAMTVHSAVDFNMQIPANALQMAVLFGILATPYSLENLPIGKMRGVALFGLRCLLALGGLAFMIYTAKWVPSEYYAERSRVALRDNYLGDSLRFAEEGIKWDALNPELYFYAGESLRIEGEKATVEKRALLRKSIEYYKKAVSLFPLDSRLLLKTADALGTAGDYEAASEYLDFAEQVDPNSALIPANRGLLELRFGDVEEANDYFAAARKLDFNEPLAVWGMEQTQKLLGKGISNFISVPADKLNPSKVREQQSK